MSKDVTRRNGGAGPGPLKVCCPIWNTPRSVMQSSKELHSCLAPLVKKGNLLDLAMLDVAKKDPMAPPVPREGASSPEPRAEEPISLLPPVNCPL